MVSQPKLRDGLKGLPLNNKGHSSSLSLRKFQDFWNSVPGIGDEDQIYVSYCIMISQLSSSLLVITSLLLHYMSTHSSKVHRNALSLASKVFRNLLTSLCSCGTLSSPSWRWWILCFSELRVLGQTSLYLDAHAVSLLPGQSSYCLPHSRPVIERWVVQGKE